jgi:small-conductance mechanosensitive channel
MMGGAGLPRSGACPGTIGSAGALSGALRRVLGCAALLAVALLLVAAAEAQQASLPEAQRRAPVVIEGAELFELRGTSALPPEERAAIVRQRILDAARDPGFDPADLDLVPGDGSVLVSAGQRLIVSVVEADAQLEGVEPRVLALTFRDRIAEAITEYRATRSPGGMRTALQLVALETGGLIAVLLAIYLLERLSARLIHRYVESRVALWEERARDVVRLQGIWHAVRRGVRYAFVAAAVVAVVVWLNSVLLTLPWTKDIGREVARVFTEPLGRVIVGIVNALPDLLTIALIAVLAVAALRVAHRFFEAVRDGRLRFQRFEPDWAAPTARLVRLGIIVLAIVMAYPFIPGSSSEAFKGLSILAGVMLSLGATSIVANAIAGQSLIYRRAFSIGDRIEVDGVVGDVVEIKSQVTWLRTPKNEHVTIPNSVLLASRVTNYSRYAREQRLILHTEVGIGYEVPWRLVESMLIEAARRTPGLLASPPPYVLQKRLADYSPVYEINAYTADPAGMPQTYSDLHGNIQDVFAEHGVQIMTPSYVADPPDLKVPPMAEGVAQAAKAKTG